MNDEWKMKELLDDAGVPPRPQRLTEQDIVDRAAVKKWSVFREPLFWCLTLLGSVLILLVSWYIKGFWRLENAIGVLFGNLVGVAIIAVVSWL